MCHAAVNQHVFNGVSSSWVFYGTCGRVDQAVTGELGDFGFFFLVTFFLLSSRWFNTSGTSVIMMIAVMRAWALALFHSWYQSLDVWAPVFLLTCSGNEYIKVEPAIKQSVTEWVLMEKQWLIFLVKTGRFLSAGLGKFLRGDTYPPLLLKSKIFSLSKLFRLLEKVVERQMCFQGRLCPICPRYCCLDGLITFWKCLFLCIQYQKILCWSSAWKLPFLSASVRWLYWENRPSSNEDYSCFSAGDCKTVANYAGC